MKAIFLLARRAQWIKLVGAVAVCMVGCASDGDWRISRSPGFDLAGHHVSVLGVFHDGRLGAKFWQVLATPFAPAFGGWTCGAGFDETLDGTNHALYAKLDQEAKEDGVGHDLIAEVAPHAQGDLILVATLFGKLPEHHSRAPGAPQTSVGRGGGHGGGGGMRGGRGGGGGGRRTAPEQADENALEISAVFYSASTSEPVLQVGSRYTSDSADEALTNFGGKLHELLPHARCAGWQWSEAQAPGSTAK